MEAKTETQADSLKRVFGLTTLTIYGVGDILGAGIYAVIGKIAGISGSLVWASYVFAAIVAALTAWSYAELGSRFPRSGGVAYFIHQAFRREWLSLIVGWLMFCTCLVSMATLSKAFAGYLSAFMPQFPDWAIVLTLFAALTLVNFRGIAESSILNIVCTAIEVSGLVIVILVASLFLIGGGTSVDPATTNAIANTAAVPWQKVIEGAALAFYAFIGFEDIVNVAEEVKNPERNVPRAILIAIAIATVIYTIVSGLATSVISPSALAASKAPLLDVVTQSQPNFPRIVFAFIPLFAVLNTALLNFVTASRLLYGMSREGLLPAWLGRLHHRQRTPYRTFLVILPIVIFLALSGRLEFLAGATATLILLMFCGVNLSLLAIKQRDRSAPTGRFNVPFVVPALALISNLILIYNATNDSKMLASAFVGIGLVLILLRRVLTPGRAIGNS